jgi:serine/threonine protein phosphatase PrpC
VSNKFTWPWNAKTATKPTQVGGDTLIETPKNNSAPSVRVFHAQSIGMVRKTNQDSLQTFTATFQGDEKFVDFGLYVVADGMGGHSSGEKASALATRTIHHEVLQQIYLPMLLNPQDQDLAALPDALHTALEKANTTVHEQVANGGTTVTAALIVAGRVLLGHVGDSRAYLVAPTGFVKLTQDHSLVQRLQDLGQITADEAAVHPQRNVLYRAIGQGEGLEIDVYEPQLEPGQSLLLCSDGLWSLVSDAQLQAIVQSSPDLQLVCERLVQAANQAGGVDNITALIVECVR